MLNFATTTRCFLPRIAVLRALAQPRYGNFHAWADVTHSKCSAIKPTNSSIINYSSIYFFCKTNT